MPPLPHQPPAQHGGYDTYPGQAHHGPQQQQHHGGRPQHHQQQQQQQQQEQPDEIERLVGKLFRKLGDCCVVM